MFYEDLVTYDGKKSQREGLAAKIIPELLNQIAKERNERDSTIENIRFKMLDEFRPYRKLNPDTTQTHFEKSLMKLYQLGIPMVSNITPENAPLDEDGKVIEIKVEQISINFKETKTRFNGKTIQMYRGYEATNKSYLLASR